MIVIVLRTLFQPLPPSGQIQQTTNWWYFHCISQNIGFDITCIFSLRQFAWNVNFLETIETFQNVICWFFYLARRMEASMYFREFLGNLTRGMYILNDDFHKESSTRYQDVHNLVLELNAVKNNMTSLQSQVNKLLGVPNTQNTSTTSPVTASPQSSITSQPQLCTGTGTYYSFHY